jgi:hypothetical protein
MVVRQDHKSPQPPIFPYSDYGAGFTSFSGGMGSAMVPPPHAFEALGLTGVRPGPYGVAVGLLGVAEEEERERERRRERERERRKRGQKLEWRERWVVIRDGWVYLCKERDVSCFFFSLFFCFAFVRFLILFLNHSSVWLCVNIHYSRRFQIFLLVPAFSQNFGVHIHALLSKNSPLFILISLLLIPISRLPPFFLLVFRSPNFLLCNLLSTFHVQRLDDAVCLAFSLFLVPCFAFLGFLLFDFPQAATFRYTLCRAF